MQKRPKKIIVMFCTGLLATGVAAGCSSHNDSDSDSLAKQRADVTGSPAPPAVQAQVAAMQAAQAQQRQQAERAAQAAQTGKH